MKANPYIITLKTPDGPREFRVRAWNVPDATMQAVYEAANTYAAGADLSVLRIAPDESAEVPVSALEGMFGRGKKT